MAWTDDRVERLKKLWSEGLSASQIAKELGGVTRNAVIGKVHRLGLSGRATPSRPPRRVIKPRAPRVARRPLRPLVTTPVTPAPAPTPVEPQPLPNGEFATVLTLSNHICKWPIGDPSDPGFRFCGRKAQAGSSYCEAHAQVAFQPARRRRRSAEDADAALDAIAAARRLSW
ncbi:MAG: GcrA cell cycle regulator [Caulobacterales bacterium]|nr:GcrA cell cycle regulator [Caulobacterales bacterium]